MNTPQTWSDSPIHDELAAWELLKEARRERDEAREYADKLAEGLPEGMLPKDVEVLREANLGLATELAAVTEQRDQWKEKYIQQNKDLGHELRDPNGTIWSECKRLQTQLTAVTEQRDEAREILREIRDNEVNPEDEADRFLRDHVPSELSKVREQRDRLADLTKQFIAILDITEESDGGRLFHPTKITSCRAGDLQKIGELFEALRRASRTTKKP
jgi:signal transduction histidine kinase